MADPKTLLVSKGTGEPVPMTTAEYRSMMNSLSPQARRQVKMRGNVQSVVTDQGGHVTEESLSHEQVSARVDRGEDPVLLPGDPRRGMIRAKRQEEEAYNIASDSPEARASMIARFYPFVGQAMQDVAVGTDAAVKARNELQEAHSGVQFGVDLAMMAAGGAGLAAGLSRAGFNLASKGLMGFGNLAATGAAQDTYMYATYLADQNIPFQAEDYGRALMTGALFNVPLAGLAAARGAVIKGVGGALQGGGGALQGGGDLLGGIADAYVTKAVLSKPGTIGAATAARAGAGFRMLSKLGRKMRGKQVNVAAVTSPLEEAQKFHAYQDKRIASLTPAKLSKMTTQERIDLWEEVSGWAGVVDDISKDDFIKMPARIKALDTKAAVLDKQVDAVTQKVGTWTKGLGGRGSAKQKAAYVAHMEKTLGDLENAGWGDMVVRLRESIELDAKGKMKANPHEQFGKIVQARLAARIERAVTGGAAQADDALREVLENTAIWGKGQAPGIIKKLNTAIDDIAGAQAEIKRLNAPKNLKDIDLPDTRRGQRLTEQMDVLKKAYAVLEEHKMLSTPQVKALQKTFKQVADAASESSSAHSVAAKVNRTRGKAAGNITERLQRVEQAAQDFEALRLKSTVEEAHRFTIFGKDAKTALTKGANFIAAAPITGVMVIRQMHRDDKDLLFNHISKQLATMTGAPEAMEDAFAPFLGATQEANPTLTDLSGAQAARTIHYLSTSLPKPSYSLHGGLEPSTTQKEAFLQKYAAIMDPLSVGYAALSGRVTPSMIEALRVTQPAAYAEVSNMLAEAIAEATPKASRKTINGVQAFLGGLDPLYRGEVLMQLQSNYAQNAEQNTAINGPGMQGQFNNPQNPQKDNNFTFTQRLQSY